MDREGPDREGADRLDPSVHLVGAGPGHPGLITRRGLELLRRAEVLIVDSLANAELLLETRPDVEIVRMDRALSHDRRHRRAMIDLLVRWARSGRRVVRLKGGDPFLFGRGGEEAQALREAGILFEVVPGVSSAFAVPALAGIPLTDRRHASTVLLATGSSAPGSEPVDFARAARAADTLVVLMGLSRIEEIVEGLLRGGRDRSEPAAVVSRGTLPRQRTVTAPLGEIPRRVAEAALETPALMIVGSVVQLRESLAMFENRPLFGRRVVVTRPRAQSVKLVQRLVELGADPVLLPTIQVRPVAPDDAGKRALIRAGAHDVVFFTSANAVRRTLEELEGLGLDARALAGSVLVAVGNATARALRDHGLRADRIPSTFSQLGICEMLGADGIAGRTFLYPKARRTEKTLAETIPAAGGTLVEVVLYETVSRSVAEHDLPEAIRSGGVDLVTFTSPSTARGFFDLLGAERAARLLEHATAVSIGKTTARALGDLGVRDVVVPKRATMEAMVQAMVQAMVRAAGSGEGST